jgi:hypothetical protein
MFAFVVLINLPHLDFSQQRVAHGPETAINVGDGTVQFDYLRSSQNKLL